MFNYRLNFLILTILSIIFNVDACKSAKENDDPYITASNMKFHLNTRVLTKEFILNDTTNLNYEFSPEKVTKILVHGWKNKWNSSFNAMLVKSYLNYYDANVFVVDWSQYSGCTNYLTSKNNVPSIASVVALLIEKLNMIGLNPLKTHMIGFSLGAHVSGIAGLKIKTDKLYRITGLDPAGPFFSMSDKYRLRNDSARFVDVIHTGMRMAGTKHIMGLADFYPNGGKSSVNVIKSHRKAYYYFNESIGNPGGFKAKRCDHWSEFKKDICKYHQFAEMGEHVSTSARGRFFLQTNKEPPYARFELSLRYNNAGIVRVSTGLYILTILYYFNNFI